VFFRGHAGWIDEVGFTTAFVFAIAYSRGGVQSFFIALIAGAFSDAVGGACIHTPIYACVYLAAEAIRGMFYTPGSFLHMLSFLGLISIFETVHFALQAYGAGGFYGTGFPALFILSKILLDYCCFLVMLLLFRERSRAVMYKMR